MKLSRILLSAFLVTVLSGVLTSCRDELCYNHYPSLGVALNWEYEWERDYGMHHSDNWDSSVHGFEYGALRPGRPEWVNLIQYSADGERTETYLAEDETSLRVSQEEGQSMLLYNGDTEYLIFQDIASLTEARATPTKRSRSSIAGVIMQHPGLSTTNPPDLLYSAYIDNIPYVEGHNELHFPIKMQPLVFTYVIRYEFESGLKHVRQARGALGGMAESVYLRDSHTSDEATIILFDCEVTDYGCAAYVRSFGVPGFPDEYYGRGTTKASDRPYTLNLEVLLTNGSTMEFNFDVADQLLKQPKGGVITVKGLTIKEEENKPSESTGGFDVDLSGWNNIEQDLPVGPSC
ncbi:MAG: DUF5119 domain-containing protein [Muribaculaceae bacterium]|nr:DUF5119 domain-containing protein [Muribaculaceae bacterium]